MSPGGSPLERLVTSTTGGVRSGRDTKCWNPVAPPLGGMELDEPPVRPDTGTATVKLQTSGTGAAPPATSARTDTSSPGRKGVSDTKLAPLPCE